MRVLVFATDVLPLAGLSTSGTALRTFGFVQGFRAHGHEVVVSVPKGALAGMLRNIDRASLDEAVRTEIAQLEEFAFDFASQERLVAAVRPDMVYCGHWPAGTFPRRLSMPVVIDLAGPHLLERHYQGTPDHAGATLAKLHALANADYFIVSGAKQRLYFMSFMLRAGVERPETRTLTIHMPLDPRIPDRPERSDQADYPRFVFGGIFLPWQDPGQALEQTAEVLAARGRGSLTLIGGPHPHYPIEHGVTAGVFARLKTHPRVRVLPVLPYSDFLTELATADVAVDVMRWNLERELAMTIRSTTYLWSGVPVIYNDYADLGDLIRGYDAGWTVSPASRASLETVLNEVFDSPESVARKGERGRQLAREVFAWDRAVAPLLSIISGSSHGRGYEFDIDLALPENAAIAVLRDQPVEQYFLSRIDGLARVECCLATHGRASTALESVTLRLYSLGDGEDGGDGGDGSVERNGPRQLLVERQLRGDSIRNNEWHVLEFDAIARSAGQRFVLSILSDARRAEESISPWACTAKPFPLLALFQGATAYPDKSLCLRTLSRL